MEFIADNISDLVDASVDEAMMLAEYFYNVQDGHCEDMLRDANAKCARLKRSKKYFGRPIGIEIFAPSMNDKRRVTTTN